MLKRHRPVAAAQPTAAAPNSAAVPTAQTETAAAQVAAANARLDELATLMEEARKAGDVRELLALRGDQLQAFRQWQRARADVERFELQTLQAQLKPADAEIKRWAKERDERRESVREAEREVQVAVSRLQSLVGRARAAELRIGEIEAEQPPAFSDPYHMPAA